MRFRYSAGLSSCAWPRIARGGATLQGIHLGRYCQCLSFRPRRRSCPSHVSLRSAAAHQHCRLRGRTRSFAQLNYLGVTERQALVRPCHTSCRRGEEGRDILLREDLLLQQTSGDKSGNCRNQPFDPPQLDRLPVQRCASAKENANSQCSHQAHSAQKKCGDGGSSESKPLTKTGKFGQAWNSQNLLGVQSGTLNATGMAVEGTDNKLGSALAAGRGSFQLNYGVGRQHRWAPEFMLSLIGCFCHKKLFLSFAYLTQANRQMNLL